MRREAIYIQLRNSHCDCDTVTKSNNGANPQYSILLLLL